MPTLIDFSQLNKTWKVASAMAGVTLLGIGAPVAIFTFQDDGVTRRVEYSDGSVTQSGALTVKDGADGVVVYPNGNIVADGTVEAETQSGSSVHASQSLTSSGILVVDGQALLNGVFKLVSLDCTGNVNGGALTAGADGTVTCTDDDGGGGGSSPWTDDGTTVRLTQSSDNVGIGTTNATRKLTLSGSMAMISPEGVTGALLALDGTPAVTLSTPNAAEGNGSYYMTLSTGTASGGTVGDIQIRGGTSLAEGYNGGNVLIEAGGNTYGAEDYTGPNIFMAGALETGAGQMFLSGGLGGTQTGAKVYIDGGTDQDGDQQGPVILQANGDGGRVGIGTITPKSTLSVMGTMSGTNLSVNGTFSWGKLSYTAPSSHLTDGFLKNDGAGGLSWAAGSGGGGTTVVHSGLQSLTGAKNVSGYIGNMSTGDNIMYTAPAGKRAMINGFNVFNANASSRNFYPIWRIGGVNYKYSGVLAVSAGSMNQVATSVNIILEPGESFGINVTGSDVNAWARIVEYDDTVPVYAAKKVGSWASGDNTIYTVPTGKNATLVDGVGMLAQNVTSMNYYNSSGGSRTIQWHSVPNGGSTGATTRVSGSVAVGNDARSTQVMSHSLNSGDFIVLNTNATTDTQVAWVMVSELPN